jgi:hypothetical protein
VFLALEKGTNPEVDTNVGLCFGGLERGRQFLRLRGHWNAWGWAVIVWLLEEFPWSETDVGLTLRNGGEIHGIRGNVLTRN